VILKSNRLTALVKINPFGTGNVEEITKFAKVI